MATTTTASLNTKGKDMTLTFLGCGNLGTAILAGILASIKENKSQSGSAPETGSGTPSKFIACVRRPVSEERILKAVDKYDEPLTVLKNDNIKGVQEADVIILGCKPYMVKDVLDVDGMREALKGKLLISILAGVPASQIENTLYGDGTVPQTDRCHIVRAMPNTAAVIRESMTVIEISTPPLPDHLNVLTDWIFTRIGRVVQLPASTMDASTALAGSGPAFMALVLEAMIDGGVSMGLPRAEAQLMGTQVMRGTTGMVLDGEHPALLREKVCTPGGCTIGGLLVLEEGTVRGNVSRAVREATCVASQLGLGVKGVNGTRH